MIAVNGGVKGGAVDRVQSVVIVGGGPSGWLAAAALGRLLAPSFCQVRLIDLPAEAGPLSEAALPSFHRLNKLLGIDEEDLLQKTHGTFRLGAQFADWGRIGQRYFHGFGSLGAKLEAVPFQHYWLKLRRMGEGAGIDAGIEEYSTAAAAARLSRFARPIADRRSVLSLYSYGYHFRAESLAAYLRQYAQAHGVIRIEGDIVAAQLRSEDGCIDAVLMKDGSRVAADLYIDCTGAGVLSQQALKFGYVDWSRWLPCDRLVSVASTGGADLAPYSESVAERLGWRRRVPLQGCAENGFVYSRTHLSDDEAAAMLLSGVEGRVLGAPGFLQVSPGRPAQFWNKNCVALTGGMLDPLESTGLHLVQTGITRLISLFPVGRSSPEDQREYNRLTGMEHERIRDYLILHYKCTQRGDSPFWERCREMDIPDTLRTKIELFRHSGRISMLDEEHFGEASWLALFLGLNIEPTAYDPLADVLDVSDARAALSHMRSMIREAVITLPTHARFIEEHCAAKTAGVFA
jgi:tryptophan 7-halogenase